MSEESVNRPSSTTNPPMASLVPMSGGTVDQAQQGPSTGFGESDRSQQGMSQHFLGQGGSVLPSGVSPAPVDQAEMAVNHQQLLQRLKHNQQLLQQQQNQQLLQQQQGHQGLQQQQQLQLSQLLQQAQLAQPFQLTPQQQQLFLQQQQQQQFLQQQIALQNAAVMQALQGGAQPPMSLLAPGSTPNRGVGSAWTPPVGSYLAGSSASPASSAWQATQRPCLAGSASTATQTSRGVTRTVSVQPQRGAAAAVTWTGSVAAATPGISQVRPWLVTSSVAAPRCSAQSAARYVVGSAQYGLVSSASLVSSSPMIPPGGGGGVCSAGARPLPNPFSQGSTTGGSGQGAVLNAQAQLQSLLHQGQFISPQALQLAIAQLQQQNAVAAMGCSQALYFPQGVVPPVFAAAQHQISTLVQPSSANFKDAVSNGGPCYARLPQNLTRMTVSPAAEGVANAPCGPLVAPPPALQQQQPWRAARPLLSVQPVSSEADGDEVTHSNGNEASDNEALATNEAEAAPVHVPSPRQANVQPIDNIGSQPANIGSHTSSIGPQGNNIPQSIVSQPPFTPPRSISVTAGTSQSANIPDGVRGQGNRMAAAGVAKSVAAAGKNTDGATGSGGGVVAAPGGVRGAGGPPPARQTATVMPQILTHVIEGFVIQEGPEPFPVQRSSFLCDSFDSSDELSDSSTEGGAADNETDHNRTSRQKSGSQQQQRRTDDEPTIRCAFCGTLIYVPRVGRVARFCSQSCSKRCAASTRWMVHRATQGGAQRREGGAGAQQGGAQRRQGGEGGVGVPQGGAQRKQSGEGRGWVRSREEGAMTGSPTKTTTQTLSPSPPRQPLSPRRPTAPQISPPGGSLVADAFEPQLGEALSDRRGRGGGLVTPPALRSPGGQSAGGAREEGGLRHPSEEIVLPASLTQRHPSQWGVSDVYGFVRALPGCAMYADEFRAQEIDGQALLLLKEDHLMSALGVKLGPALKICSQIAALKDALV